MKQYLAIYRDKFGEENTEIFSDGSNLYLILRGITFAGVDFELLEGLLDESQFEYKKYSDGSAILTNFELKVCFPIKLTTENIDEMANLIAVIATGNKKESQVY